MSPPSPTDRWGSGPRSARYILRQGAYRSEPWLRCEPDRVFGLRIIEGLPVHGQLTFEPTEIGTRFRFRVYSQPTGMMRIIHPIMSAMLRR